MLRYLLAHQDSRGSIEGIKRWWLPQDQPYRRSDIETALRTFRSGN